MLSEGYQSPGKATIKQWKVLMKETWLKEFVDKLSPWTKVAIFFSPPFLLMAGVCLQSIGNPFVPIEHRISEDSIYKCAKTSSEVSSNENVQEKVFDACLQKRR